MAKISTRDLLAAYVSTHRPSKWTLVIIFILLVFVSYWTSNYVTVGDAFEVSGILTSVKPPHGIDSGFLVFEMHLEGERNVVLYLPEKTPANIGEKVRVSVQPTLLGGESYRFVGYQD